MAALWSLDAALDGGVAVVAGVVVVVAVAHVAGCAMVTAGTGGGKNYPTIQLKAWKKTGSLLDLQG